MGLRLSRQTGNKRPGSAAARELGEEASNLRLSLVDITRLHSRLLDGFLAASTTPPAEWIAKLLTPANRFLIDVLSPLEARQRQQATPVRGNEVRRLGIKLLQRTAALQAVQEKLRREIAQRKSGEKKILEGAQHYSQLLLEAQRLQSQSRRVAHQVLLAQEAERKEISRELHDEVVQILAGINVQLATLKEASAINSRSLRTRISKTQRLVEQSVRIVHRYARRLRPAMLDDLGLIPALRAFMRELPGRSGLRIQFTAFAGVEMIDNARRTVLFRVAQEALTNVTRHARAHCVKVRVLKVGEVVRLEVHDDGRSFAVARVLASSSNKRLGLIGMRERVEMVGGTLTLLSSPGQGTRVTADIPFRVDPDHLHL